MTRANRRVGRVWSKHRLTETEYHCEECEGLLLHHYAEKYICSKCGLEQRIKQKCCENDEDKLK
jgi:hypothetical protein